MGDPSHKDPEATGAPARNFSLGTEERVRAITAGPPAHLRRLRAIEDLEETIVRFLAECFDQARAASEDAEAYARARAPKRALERLADLIDRHNRFYPIEANLPMHPRTGQLVDRTGAPFRPMPRADLAHLLARARTRSPW
jgi:hypothetical protein